MNAIRTSATALLALLGMLAWTLTAQAQHQPSKVIEASVETSGDAVHFPSSASGRILVQGCPECRDQSLQLDAASAYFIDGQRVTLAQITGAARGGANRPLTIHFRVKDKVVTRVDLTSS
jgi:DNA replicative helicase MCM subunit Mcm2 (Cdc46/Mcm family)